MSVSGYLLTPDIFDYIEKAEPDGPMNSEFMIQPIMINMMKDNKALYAFKMKDTQYCDTGAKVDYLKTVVQFALRNKDIGDDFKEYLRSLVL